MNLPTEKHQQSVQPSDEQEDEATAAEILESLPPEQVLAVIKSAYHSGPVPSPQALQQYNDILPGLADRLVTMAEKEQSIRAGETRHFSWNVTLKVFASVIVSLAMVLGGVYCAIIGEPTVGGIIATSGVISGVVQSYLRRSSKKGDEGNDED